jgi:hypothetical protein
MRMNSHVMPFFSVEMEEELEQFRCFEEEISASLRISSEHLATNRLQSLQDLFIQLCWPLWQGGNDFPEVQLRLYISDLLARMGIRT